ncbi:MAG: hypothetical protein IKN77_02200 [Paludibacteraceae bacterium]|nr:hypothetical protein [Paludibacteraceae bacterium]
MNLKKFGVAAMGIALSVSTANAESFETLSVSGKSALYGGLSVRTALYHQLDFKDEADGSGSVIHTTGYNDSKFGLSFEASKFAFRDGNVGIGTEPLDTKKLYVKGDTWFEGNINFNVTNNSFHVQTTGNSGIAILHSNDRDLEKSVNTIESKVQGNLTSLHFNASDYKFRYGNAYFKGNVSIGAQGSDNNKLYVKGRTVLDVSDEMLLLLTSPGTSIHFDRVVNNEGEVPTNTITSDEIGGYSPLNFRGNSYRFYIGSVLMDKDLTVNGKITCHDEIEVSKLTSDNMNVNQLKAKDIRVDLNNAADYVFEDNYNLKSLKEVESYVKENKHLPGIPSAAEISQNGMSVSEMSNLLLEKVEELTLHLIQLEKENEALKAKVESLDK